MMSATYFWVILLLGVLCLAPWAIKAAQRKAWLRAAPGNGMRVLSTLALGTQQRIVTVEVGDAAAPTVLVLGVTPHTITTLHTLAPRAPRGAQPTERFDTALQAAEGRP